MHSTFHTETKALFEPPPQKNCIKCKGSGFVISAKGEYSHASRCSCIPVCQLCFGKGVRTIEVEGTLRTGRCRCQKLPDRIKIYNHALIPAIHGKNCFETFRHLTTGATLAAKSCNSWMQQFDKKNRRGLILTGPVGRGKTHLLVSILRSLIFQKGIRVRFIEFTRLLTILRDGYTKGDSNQKLMTELSTVPVLAIDELGKGRLTSWELSIIDEVISRRYNTKGLIVATTNYKWGPPQSEGVTLTNLAENFNTQTLGDRVGDRVFSRLQESCFFAPVQGEDFRARRVQKIN